MKNTVLSIRIVISCGFIPRFTQEEGACFCLMVILIVYKNHTNMLFNTKIGNTEYIIIVIARIIVTLYNAWGFCSSQVHRSFQEVNLFHLD